MGRGRLVREWRFRLLQNLYGPCPVNRHVLETELPFFWIKRGNGERETYRVVARPTGPGIKGLQVPIFGSCGPRGCDELGGTTIDSGIANAPRVPLIAAATFQLPCAGSSLRRSCFCPRAIGARVEVIRWIASGRRQADVALLLGLVGAYGRKSSPPHSPSLRSSSTAQAVQVLVRAGAFRLPDSSPFEGLLPETVTSSRTREIAPNQSCTGRILRAAIGAPPRSLA